MAGVVAEAGCAVVLMHSRGELASMQRDIGFRDVVAEVRAELAERADAALAAGIARTAIVLDPGIGFGKTVAQNLELLRRLDLLDLGLPLLIGASRKSFIGALSGAEPDERLAGSLAAVAWAAAHGAAMVRVHDVAASHQFLEVWNAIRDAGQVCP
jgi:dihydropteroate synthase